MDTPPAPEAALLPETVDVPTLAGLYELLTGREPITPAAG
jgi:hypothetical protein